MAATNTKLEPVPVVMVVRKVFAALSAVLTTEAVYQAFYDDYTHRTAFLHSYPNISRIAEAICA